MKYIMLMISCIYLLPSICLAQEVQIPFDEDGKYFTITRELESELGLFPEIASFIEARLFEAEDRSRFAEVSFNRDNRIVRERIPLDDRRLAEIRMKIQIYESREIPRVYNHEGRVRFIRTITTMNVFYYGIAVPYIFEMNAVDGVSYYLLSSGAAFYVPFYLTERTDVTESMADVARFGARRGYVIGSYAAHSLYGIDASMKNRMIFNTTGSMGGIIAGYKLAENYEWTRGQVGIISLYTDYGLVGGNLAGLAISGNENSRLRSSLGLLGGAAGFSVANLYGFNANHTYGNTRAMRGFTVLSAVTTLTLTERTIYSDPRFFAASTAIGTGVGLYLSHKLMDGLSLSDTEGSLIGLSGYFGLVLGTGLAYAIYGTGEENLRAYLTLSSAAGITGYLLVYNYYKRNIASDNQLFSSILTYDINPLALIQLHQAGDTYQRNVSYRNALPLELINIRYTF